MTPEILDWGARIILPTDVAGKDVLEVGSQDVNGSLRPHVLSLGPRSYLGVDSEQTPNVGGVDEVVRAEDLVERFGIESFDLTLSTEMLEHALNWQECVWQMKAVTRPGGLNVVTTRSVGFPYHPFPVDHWRYSVGDMEAIYGDWEILDLTDDWGNPGVFIKARRPAEWDPAAGKILLDGLTVTAQRQSY